MTAYELEGLSVSEVLPFPFLELNKDLHCSKRNKPWVTSRALIHIRTEILKHASVTFSINYWVSKWWWFDILPSSLLTIACFPPKNYVPVLKQRGRRLNTAKQLSDFTVFSVCGKHTLFSLITLSATTQRVISSQLQLPEGVKPEQGCHSETGGLDRDETNTELVRWPCILTAFFTCWCHPVSRQSIANHTALT